VKFWCKLSDEEVETVVASPAVCSKWERHSDDHSGCWVFPISVDSVEYPSFLFGCLRGSSQGAHSVFISSYSLHNNFLINIKLNISYYSSLRRNFFKEEMSSKDQNIYKQETTVRQMSSWRECHSWWHCVNASLFVCGLLKMCKRHVGIDVCSSIWNLPIDGSKSVLFITFDLKWSEVPFGLRLGQHL